MAFNRARVINIIELSQKILLTLLILSELTRLLDSEDNEISTSRREASCRLSRAMLLSTAMKALFIFVDSVIFLWNQNHLKLDGSLSIDRHRPFPATPLSEDDIASRDFIERLELPLPDELICPINNRLMSTPVYHPSCKQQVYDESLLDAAQTYEHGKKIMHPHLNQIVSLNQFKIHETLQQKISLFLTLLKNYFRHPAFIQLPTHTQKAVYKAEILDKYHHLTTAPSTAALRAEGCLLFGMFAQNGYKEYAQKRLLSHAATNEEKPALR
jgi:hypothetical protein